jgi:hypothetical protein
MRRLLPVALAVVSLVVVAGPARANTVAVFFNTAYVDTATDGSGEAYNVQQGLLSLGHTVDTFTGFTATAFREVMITHNVLVFPEFQNGNLSLALSQEALLMLATFVNGGGTLIMFDPGVGDPLAVLNGAFPGFNLTSAGAAVGTIAKAPGAANTPFANGPATLPANLNAVDTVLASSLPGSPTVPATSRIIYGDANGNAAVALISYGSGNIVILGWDWFNAQPVGTQDGGWLEVLDTAADIEGTRPIPTLSEWAMIAMAGLLIALGLATLRRSRGLAA